MFSWSVHGGVALRSSAFTSWSGLASAECCYYLVRYPSLLRACCQVDLSTEEAYCIGVGFRLWLRKKGGPLRRAHKVSAISDSHFVFACPYQRP